MHRRSLFGRSLAMVSLVVLGGAALAQEAAPPKVAIEPDGTVHMPLLRRQHARRHVDRVVSAA